MLIKNARLAIYGEEDLVRADIRMSDQKIREIARDLNPSTSELVLDASGLEIFPGALDPHVHFDEPGFTSREDFLHGSAEAARGGVTTIIDMPCTSLPPITNYSALENKLSIVSKNALVDFGLYGGVSGLTVEESINSNMEEIAKKVMGFKCYFISGMKTFTRVSHDDFARIVKKADELDRPVLLHAEDLDLITGATVRLRAERGSARSEWMDYALSRPEAAEVIAVNSAIALAKDREKTIHIVHVGTASAALIAYNAGASCETCSHYLAFGREDFASLGSSLKTAPPVKSRAESKMLWQFLADGVISFLTSDHAPCSEEEKNTGDVWTAYGGIPGVGLGPHYLYSEGLRKKRLSLKRYIEATSLNAARRYGLDRKKGSIEVSKDADFFLLDPNQDKILKGQDLLSKGKIIPFEGMKLSGAIIGTMLRGNLVWADNGKHLVNFKNSFDNKSVDIPGILAKPGYGKFLTRGCS